MVQKAFRAVTHVLGQISLDREVWQPGDTIAHRADVDAADGAGTPAANNALWSSNTPGARIARFYINVDFTGGTNPTAQMRFWHKTGSANVDVGGSTATTDLAEGRYAVDIEVFGDDVLALVQAVTGSPSAFEVDVQLSWR